ncbi:hypothetical protein STEG23_031081 [Scotinomys teguina]
MEEEMSRHQCKNSGNNTKTYMIPSEPSGSTPARPEHTNAEETEEINHKNYFKKMIETIMDSLNTVYHSTSTTVQFKDFNGTTTE